MGKSHRALASRLDPRSQTVLEALEKKVREQPNGEWQVATYSQMNADLELRGFKSSDIRILVAGLNTQHKIILTDNRQGTITVRLPSLVSEELRAALDRELSVQNGHLRLSSLAKLRNCLSVTGLENDALRTALEQLRADGGIDFTISSSGEVEVWQKKL